MRKLYFFGLIGLVVLVIGAAYAEQITFTTYYPAPYGVYKEFKTTDNTYLATDGGNVGIGTTNPSDALVIHKDAVWSGSWAQLQIEPASQEQFSGISLKNTFGTDRVWNIFAGGQAAPYPGTFRIFDNTAWKDRLIIDTNGNVGIGTVSPGAKLDVTADSQTWGGWYEAIRLSQGAHSAITHPGGGLLFGLHSNRNFYWADTTNGWYVMTLNANGNLSIRGTLSKGGGSFLIDHVLDPENKVLRHSFIESPEPVLIYKGRAKLVDGKAIIKLPEYFDALNHLQGREINLTCIGGWSPLYLEGEISENSFIVKTIPEGNPNQEFSWVVYGLRNDAFIQKNPIIVEEEKGVGNEFSKGEYIHPEVFAVRMAKE